MDDRQRIQESINSRILPHIPAHAWQSTVALVAADRPAVRQIGSGILFQVADCQFLVTAGHVVRAAHKYQKTLGLADVGGENIIALTGESTCSVPGEDSIDPYDVAVHQLPASTVAKLRDKRFLRIGDVEFVDPGPKAVYTIFGYPALWSEPILEAEDDRIWVKPLEFTTYAYDGNVGSLTGYRPHLHVLLSGGPEDITGPDGARLEFRDRAGQPAVFPRGLKGISGCSVWHVGDLTIPMERWAERPAKAVAIETGIYQASGVITASRWAVVTTLVHKAFPHLRRSIEVWQP